jgi:zinc transporter ZupT
VIGAAVVPIPIIIVLVLLSNQSGLFKEAVSIGGAIAVRLAFVTIATAKRQGMLAEYRRLLRRMFAASLMAGALLGYLVLQYRPLELRMVLVALASGFLIMTVVKGIISEANREGEPGFAGVLYIGGLSLYALMSLALK